jgi:hypothetical protein
MSYLIERLRTRWEVRPGATMTKINRILSECREAADRIAALEAENAVLEGALRAVLDVGLADEDGSAQVEDMIYEALAKKVNGVIEECRK